MLELSRKKSEAIILRPDTPDENTLVRVMVVEIRGPRVLLNIEGPSHVQCVRAEIAEALENAVENPVLAVSKGIGRSEAAGAGNPYRSGGTSSLAESVSNQPSVAISRAVNEALLIDRKVRLTVLAIRGVNVRLGLEAPAHWLVQREEIYFDNLYRDRALGNQPADVAEILWRARSLKAPEQLEELTARLVALRARRVAPVASNEETRLLLAINEGVPVELTDRAAFLIEKRDDGSLSDEENTELLQLADDVERRGIERLAALSRLAELRGVSLGELTQSLGVAAVGEHG